jgi:hypothetical protein
MTQKIKIIDSRRLTENSIVVLFSVDGNIQRPINILDSEKKINVKKGQEIEIDIDKENGLNFSLVSHLQSM